MWEFRYKNDYLNCVYDLMADAAVQSMRLLPQHRAGVSCYHHCVLVSYSSWRLCRALGLDGRAAARGGLLHDLYLYNWRDKASHPGIRHAVQHPEVALKNARARFSVTETEADIIRSHMFPLTPTRVYHCLEALVVSTMDKLCAAAELLEQACALMAQAKSCHDELETYYRTAVDFAQVDAAAAQCMELFGVG